ncbi:hypothetical protein GW17_00008833 [Ensete ventricosum]|nr:hypothetical protein GW17_00008833 [Ensete ventricosum]
MLPRRLRRRFPQRILMTHASALLWLMTPRPSNRDGETPPTTTAGFYGATGTVLTDETVAVREQGHNYWVGEDEDAGGDCSRAVSDGRTCALLCSNANASPSAPSCRSRAGRWAITWSRAPAARRMVKERLPRESLAGHAIFHSSALGFHITVMLSGFLATLLSQEDNGPAKKWLWLIRKTLNSPDTCGSDSYHTPSPVPYPILELNADFERFSVRQKNSSLLHRRSFQYPSHSLKFEGDTILPQQMMEHRFSVCDGVSFESRPSDFDSNFRCEGSSDDENIGEESPTDIFSSPSSYGYGAPPHVQERDRLSVNSSRIIWLGDLNYRIALSYRSVKTLVEMRNWRALLEKDQVAYQ